MKVNIQCGIRTILRNINYEQRHPTKPNQCRSELNRKLTALIRFISKSAERVIPLFPPLSCIKNNNFCWTAEAVAMLKQLKEALYKLPTLASPILGETLLVYLSSSNKAISSVEREGRKCLIRCLSP
uniref:Reverse transcriptase/retrotransposon-derived protein RNase H-like domain-containing protein n=1 Tax=Lactuca sativa TaxID=4236 RepID=A0A9R1WW61_LACSA|nr:hypothetical protein LSAT_V11C800396740 [Lactuca sativa]